MQYGSNLRALHLAATIVLFVETSLWIDTSQRIWHCTNIFSSVLQPSLENMRDKHLLHRHYMALYAAQSKDLSGLVFFIICCLLVWKWWIGDGWATYVGSSAMLRHLWMENMVSFIVCNLCASFRWHRSNTSVISSWYLPIQLVIHDEFACSKLSFDR